MGSKGEVKEGGVSIANEPQYRRVYARDPFTHLPSSHFFEPREDLAGGLKTYSRVWLLGHKF